MKIRVTVEVEGLVNQEPEIDVEVAKPSLRGQPEVFTATTDIFRKLTPAELNVLKMLSAGLPYIEVGRILNISERTVRTHANHILTKLGVPNSRMATAIALASGLVTVEELVALWKEHNADILTVSED